MMDRLIDTAAVTDVAVRRCSWQDQLVSVLHIRHEAWAEAGAVCTSIINDYRSTIQEFVKMIVWNWAFGFENLLYSRGNGDAGKKRRTGRLVGQSALRPSQPLLLVKSWYDNHVHRNSWLVCTQRTIFSTRGSNAPRTRFAWLTTIKVLERRMAGLDGA